MNNPGLINSVTVVVALAATSPTLSQATFEVLTKGGVSCATDDTRSLFGAEAVGDCDHVMPNASGWTEESGWFWLEGVCGSDQSAARFVSRDGVVVSGTAVDVTGEIEFIFLWTGADQVTKLYQPDWGTLLTMGGMSGNGKTIAVTVGKDPGNGPVRWTEERAWEKLLWEGEWPYGGATAAANDGTVVGYAGDAATLWPPDGVGITLPPPDGFTGSTPVRITSNAQFVFGYSFPPGDYARFLTRWTPNAQPQSLGAMPYESKLRSVYPRGVSSDGNRVVGVWILGGASSEPAFIWNARDGIRDLREVLVGDYGVDVGSFRVRNPVMMSEDGRRIIGSEDGTAWRVTLPAYCRPDCNADGALTVNDFLCFQARWRAQDIYGDFNNDAKFNVNDYIAFQAEWRRVKDGGGCE